MDDIRPYQEQNCNNFWCTWVKWEAGSWSPNQTYLHLKIFCENSKESKSIYQVQGIKVKRWKLTHKHRDQQKMPSYKCQPTNVAIRQAQMSTLFPHLVQVVLSPGWSDRQGGRSDTNLWVCLKRLKTGNLVSFDRGAVVVVEISGLLYQLLLILMEWILIVRLNTDYFLPHS